jgi:hypothetical protein
MTHLSMIAKFLKIEVEKPQPDEIKRFWREFQEGASPAVPNGTEPICQEGQRQGRRRSVGPPPSLAEKDLGRIPSFAEIDAMARHVAVAKFPYGEHAPYFWRGWIRFLAFIGPRSRDVVSTKTTKPGLRRSDVIFETLCPVADVNNALGYELHSPHGWMHYVIGKDHHSDCRRILFPMPRWMRDWVRFFVELSGTDRDRVFGSAVTHAVALSQDTLSPEWNAIVAAAGVDARIVPSEGNSKRMAIRKFAANWWLINTLKVKNDNGLAKDVSRYILHHKEVTTSAKHYLSVQAQVLPTMLELMPLWPIPAADAPPVSLLPE